MRNWHEHQSKGGCHFCMQMVYSNKRKIFLPPSYIQFLLRSVLSTIYIHTVIFRLGLVGWRPRSAGLALYSSFGSLTELL